MNNYITLNNITKTYNGQTIINDLTIAFPQGELISIIGESGSGKSTLLNIISGNLKPDNGNVLINSVDIYTLNNKDLSNFKLFNIGFVYQFFNLIDTLNVKDNIMIIPYIQKNKDKNVSSYYQELITLLNISDIQTKYPNNISGGEMQRVAICRALICKPKILILDEATGNLDSKNTKQFLNIIKDLHKKLNITIIQVTHSSEVAKVGTIIYEMIDGKLVQTYVNS